MTTSTTNWFAGEQALQRIMQRRLGKTYEAARGDLNSMGERASTDGARWAHEADHHGPALITHDQNGNRIDEIRYDESYRHLQRLGYGGGIVAATWNPAWAAKRGDAPKALTFGLGYLFAQAEAGMYCPVCMTDGAATLLHKYGTQALKERFIPQLASTEKWFTGAMFLTEKEGGSDVGQVRTVATGGSGTPGERVTLKGDKWFCSNIDADLIMILARPEGAAPGTRGLGLYVLPRMRDDGKTRNGYRMERIKEKLGERSFPTGEVTLTDAEAYLLGGPGQGFHQMAEMLNVSRLYNAVASIAVMRRAVVESLSWVESRVAFGKQVIHHPLMTETMFDMVAEQRLALNWCFRGVELLDKVDFNNGSDAERRTLRVLTPLLKYVLGKAAVRVTSEGLEALGGNGYIEDWPLARVFRDAQVLPIWEGTTNILVLDAFRAIKKEAAHEVLFAEIEKGLSEAPSALQQRTAAPFNELKVALAQISKDPSAEATFRDWTDRAAALWMIATSCSKALGYGTSTDVRAAERMASRWFPSGLLRTDRASVDEVRRIAFS